MWLKRMRPIAVGLLVVVAVCAAVWVYRSRTLRVVAGPMLQAVGTTSFTVVWRTNLPDQGWLEVLSGDRVVMKCQGTIKHGQHVATAVGLQPGCGYAYRVWHTRDGQEKLRAGPWTCKTAPGPGSAFRLLVFGDSGTGYRDQYRLAEQMARRRFDLIIHTGDLVYKRGEAGDYADKFFAPYATILPSVAFMPVIGNHDYQTDHGRPLLDTFLLPRNGPKGTDPERHYWFDYGCARFAAIDTDVDEAELRDRVAPWLASVFESSPGRWRFVYLHFPPYTGSTTRGPVEKVQQHLAPAFDRSGVDVVFAGHNHLYERSKPIRAGKLVGQGEGVVYIVTGAGGARIRPTRPRDQWAQYVATAYDAEHSFTLIDVSLEELRLQQINQSGRIVDRWELKRPPRFPATTSRPASLSRSVQREKAGGVAVEDVLDLSIAESRVSRGQLQATE